MAGSEIGQQLSQLKLVDNEQLDVLSDAHSGRHSVLNETEAC